VPEVSRTTVSGPVLGDGIIPAPDFTGVAALGAVPEFSSAALPAASVSIPGTQTFSGFTAPTGALDMSHTASSAFSDALSSTALTPGFDMSVLERQVTMRLQELPLPQAPSLEPPWQNPPADRAKQAGPLSVNIQEFTVNAEEISDVVKLYNLFMSLVHEPEEMPV
jgi:hypothetical protein